VRHRGCRGWTPGLAWSLAICGLLSRGIEPLGFHVPSTEAGRRSDGRCVFQRPRYGGSLSSCGQRWPKVATAADTESTTELVEAVEPEDSAGTGALIVNLCKNLVGAGILSLPGGVAAVSAAKTAVLPASWLTILVGMSCAYTFSLIGRGLSLTNSQSYRGAWEKAIGKESAWLVTASVTFKTGMACLVYAMVLGDAGSSLAAGFGLPADLAARTPMTLLISLFFLLPLSFLENLEVLKYTSFLGLSGILYTLGAMAFRLQQHAYTAGGKYHMLTSAALRPTFSSTPGSWLSLPSMIFVSCLAFAFTAHYNAPKFYVQANEKLSKYNTVVAGGFGACILLCILMMAVGFLSFGGASAGLILNNYAASDKLFLIARLGISLNILCTFPLIFVSFREGIIESLPTQQRERAEKLKTPMTLGLLGATTLLAVLLKDLGPVAAVGGAVLGSAINYIFPSLIFLGATKGKARTKWLRLERFGVRGLIGFGVGLAVLGTLTSLGVV